MDRNGAKEPEYHESPYFSGVDRALTRVYGFFVIKHRALAVVGSVSLYATLVLLFSGTFGVSTNFFVVVPAVTFAFCFGLPGGIIAGVLGLPANLLLFWAKGHLEFQPASIPLAEASGFFLGTALGYLSDYFRKLQDEIRRRKAIEARLARSLEEKELLLVEFHHRIKNNLNMMKSMIQLQSNRSQDPAFKEACAKMKRRVFAIAQIHDQLYSQESLGSIDPARYLDDLLRNIVEGDSLRSGASYSLECPGGALTVTQATPLGLVVNEVVSNALKHAPVEGRPLKIDVRFTEEDGRYLLEVRDDGLGYDGSDGAGGLGTKLVRAVAEQLGGSVSYRKDRGTLFTLNFPA